MVLPRLLLILLYNYNRYRKTNQRKQLKVDNLPALYIIYDQTPATGKLN